MILNEKINEIRFYRRMWSYVLCGSLMQITDTIILCYNSPEHPYKYSPVMQNTPGHDEACSTPCYFVCRIQTKLGDKTSRKYICIKENNIGHMMNNASHFRLPLFFMKLSGFSARFGRDLVICHDRNQQTRFIESRGSGGTDSFRSYRQNPKRTDSVLMASLIMKHETSARCRASRSVKQSSGLQKDYKFKFKYFIASYTWQGVYRGSCNKVSHTHTWKLN